MNGFYSVVFEGPAGNGGGVVLLQNGQVLGGDSAYLYNGTYTETQNRLTAHVEVHVFLAGIPSVFGINPPFALEIVGTLEGNEILGQAVLAGNPRAQMRFRMTRRANIMLQAVGVAR